MTALLASLVCAPNWAFPAALFAVAGPGEAQHYGFVAGLVGLGLAILIRRRQRTVAAMKNRAD